MCFWVRNILLLMYIFMGYCCPLSAQNGLKLSEAHGFRNCNQYSKKFEITLTNLSNRSDFKEGTYIIDFGDGSSRTGLTYKEITGLSYTYQYKGVYNLRFSAEDLSGRVQSVEYTVKNLGQPSITKIDDPQYTISCVGSDFTIPMADYERNTDSTKYEIDFGDGHTKTLWQKEVGDGKIKHVYTSSHCDRPLRYKIVAINECGFEGNVSVDLQILVPPSPNFDVREPICTGTDLDIKNRTIPGSNEKCDSTTNYLWTFYDRDGSILRTSTEFEPHMNYSEAGEYEVTLTTDNGPDCSRKSFSRKFVIHEAAFANFSIGGDTACVGEDVRLNGYVTGEILEQKWEIKPEQGVQVVEGDLQHPNAIVRFNQCGVYNVQLYVQGRCTPLSKDTTIVIRKDPEVTCAVLDTLCPGTNIYFDPSKVTYVWNCNSMQAHWDFTAPSGQVYSFDQLYPSFTFSESGTYKVKVTLKGVKCGQTEVVKEFRVQVHDTTFVKNITASATEICVDEVVAFRSTSSAKQLTYLWNFDPSSYASFVNSERESASPQLKFPRWGTYQVMATLSAVCNQKWQKEFQIKVKKDPVVKIILEDELCPQVLAFSPKSVEYLWNGNEPLAHWSIEAIGSSPADGCKIDDSNVLYPRISLEKPGEYWIKVTVNPVGCFATDPIVVSKKIRVYSNSKTLVVSTSDTSLCVGERAVFFNNSLAEEEGKMTYRWNVSPETGWKYTAGDDHSKDLTLEFEEDGVYEVKSSIEICDRKDTTLYIKVKKNPEVTLHKIDTLCPGIYDLKDFVSYKWYKNQRTVSWTIDGDYSLLGGTTLTDTCPLVHFGKGAHRLYVHLNDVKLSCSEDMDKIEASRNFWVRDSGMKIQIAPVASDICENDTLKFNNRTYSGDPGLTYEWRVEQSDGYYFVGGENARFASTPQIVFTSFGNYRIHLRLASAGNCNIQERFYDVIVRGVPEVNFKPLENRCNGVPLVLDANRIDYTSNNCDLSYAWSVSPATGLVIDDQNTGTPVINFSVPGKYEVKVEVTGQCGGTKSYVRPVNVLSTEVEAAFTSSQPDGGCTDLEVEFTNSSRGDSLAYKWTILPETGWEFSENFSDTSRHLSVVFKESGNYEVMLYADNQCNNSHKETIVKAYSIPVVVSAVPEVSGVCERGFVFSGKEELTIDENNDPINRVEWTITPAGYNFINSTTDTSKYPDLTFNKGSYQMVGKYWNRCGREGSVTINLVVDEFIPIVPLRDTTVCSRTDPFRLVASPEGGIWLSVEPGMIHATSGGDYYFNPHRDAKADYEVIYVYQAAHNSCVARDTAFVHTIALPEVEAGVDQHICINEEPRVLEAVTPPVGGWWEGQGVVGADRNMFAPDVRGKRWLYYYFTSPVSGCTNMDSLTMTVWALPDTTFYTDPQHCVFADAEFRPLELNQRHHFYWAFGDGTDTLTEGPAVHRYENPGFVQVRMIAESVHGCKDTSAFRTVEVVALPPDADFTIDTMTGCGPHVLNIQVDTMRYKDKNLFFDWDFGNGCTATTLMPVNPQEYKAGVWDTVYTVRFDVYNRVCTYHRPMEKEITVYSSPKAMFAMKHEWECAPMEVEFKNLSTGNRTHYKWLFGDDSSSTRKEGKHLYLSDTVTRIYDVTLYAINFCGKDSVTHSLAVKPQSIKAFFQVADRNFCVGEDVCFRNLTTDDSLFMINQQWNFGDNALDTSWSPCHAYLRDGTFKVHLFVDNGCGFDTISDYVTVYPLPHLSIESEDALCQNDTFHFTFTSDLPLQKQEWNFGDSVFSIYAQDEHCYTGYGKRTVKLWAISSSPAICRGETEKDIGIHPLPVVQISPLDTAGCPPFIYKPEVSGDGHLMWDYGDGTELTSAAEHEYENNTDEVLHHEVKVYAESDKGCRSDYEGEVYIYNVPRAGIGKKTVTVGWPQVVEFINLSEAYDDCIWYMPSGRIVHSFENQQAVFEETELYTTSLTAVNRYGCRDSVSIEHQVVMRGLFFPNTFIPSSDNPEVNQFNGKGIGLKKYRLEIYDQNGNKVWETTALEQGKPSEGWKGTNSKGELLPQGIYIWRAQATFIDDSEWTGDNADSGVFQTTQGVVLMLKN